MISRRHPQIELAFLRLRSRLTDLPTNAFTTLFIPVGFISLLLIFVSLEVNKRLKSQATPLVLEGDAARSTTMWYSVAPQQDGGLTIASNDGNHFAIAQDGQGFVSFEEHLIAKKKQVLQDVMLANRMDETSSMVVLSVDESLTYAHIRPVIYALSRAGISRYGFEGRVLEQ